MSKGFGYNFYPYRSLSLAIITIFKKGSISDLPFNSVLPLPTLPLDKRLLPARSSSYHRVISKVIGRKISYLDISEEEAREGMKEMGMNDWLIDVIVDA